MEPGTDDASINKLNGLLLDAMNQSRALFNKLEDQTTTIDQLRRENKQLRQDLETLRTAQASSEGNDDASAQLDHLFHQDALKQAEIERLKNELKATRKDRSRQRAKSSHLASPAASSDGIEYVPSSHAPHASTHAAGILPSSTSKHAWDETPRAALSPAQKRLRTETCAGPLQVLPDSEVNIDQRRQERKGRDRSTRGAEAIPTVTEDGEDHSREENEEPVIQATAEKKQSGVHRRLDALLSATSPANSALVKPEYRPVKSASPRTPVRKVPSFTKSSSDVASTSKAERLSGMRFLRPARHREFAPEDEEPLRSRPLQRLDLSHFKLNPAYLGGNDFDGSVRNKEQKKCLLGCTRQECCGNHMRALASTLGPDFKMSEDDLLLDFLGPGSEKKITTLTSVARDNLLHEARVKKIANEYGKMHRNARDRAASPSGFWNTDMPSSQEERKHREEARQWERAEVERRHQEACKHEGKWIFADE